MKKIILFFAMVCVGALNGMESEHGHFKGLGGLSPEMQAKIIPYLLTNDNLDQTIKDIKATSLVDKELNNIINDMYVFKKLVHMLADKFNTSTENVAKKFNTPASKEYIRLGDMLIKAIGYNGTFLMIDKVIQLIKQGADVNYSYFYGNIRTPLILAALRNDTEMIQLLLNSGANPNTKDSLGKTALDYIEKEIIHYVGGAARLERNVESYHRRLEIKKLLEEAMQKQQQ